MAKQAGSGRVYWLTHESNTTAQALYDRVASRSGCIQYRLPLRYSSYSARSQSFFTTELWISPPGSR